MNIIFSTNGVEHLNIQMYKNDLRVKLYGTYEN
jgi:hypothetical protein